MKVYLIRHGETISNKEKRYMGVTDVPLSEEGIEKIRTKVNANYYPDYDGQIIYTSTLSRTKQTLKLIYGEVDYIEDYERIKDFIRKSLEESNEGETWLEATKLNSGFYNDSHVKSIEKTEACKYVFDIAHGRYSLSGENRFLSGDLLALLIQIYECSIANNKSNKFDIDKTKKTFINLKEEKLFAKRFYIVNII